MNNELKNHGFTAKCPFCQADPQQDEKYFHLKENTHWTGNRSITLSWELRHWCFEPEVRIQIVRQTLAEVVRKWNSRQSAAAAPVGFNWKFIGNVSELPADGAEYFVAFREFYGTIRLGKGKRDNEFNHLWNVAQGVKISFNMIVALAPALTPDLDEVLKILEEQNK